MSSNRYVSGYHMILRAQGMPCTLLRFNTLAPLEAWACPTSYSRNLASYSETSVSGREFIISTETLKGTDYYPLKKGDILTVAELGEMTISSIDEMIIFGQIAGFRVRTS